jgi:RND family efflux transporter MFP subunit
MTLFDALKGHVTVLVLGGIGLAVTAYEWHQARAASPSSETTSVAPRAENSRVLAEGRVVTYPDAEVTLGAELAGRLARLEVREGARVKEGDVLATIDVAEQRAALREARARVSEADVDVLYFAHERERSEILVGQNAVARASFERSVHDAKSAARHRASLLATVARLEAEVAKATITAPLTGTITTRFVEPGAYVMPGTAIVTIADLSRLRVQAEIGEFDTARVAQGARASLSAEGYAAHWRGTVEELPDQVVARGQRPLDPARPVDTRVLLARIRLDEPVPLRLGQRVEVEISAMPVGR